MLPPTSAIGDQPRPSRRQRPRGREPTDSRRSHYGDTARLHRRGGRRRLIHRASPTTPRPSSQVDTLGNSELPDVNLLALAVGVLGDELHIQDLTTPWSAIESSFSKPEAVSRPPGNSIARKSTGPSSSSSDPGWDAAVIPDSSRKSRLARWPPWDKSNSPANDQEPVPSPFCRIPEPALFGPESATAAPLGARLLPRRPAPGVRLP